MTTLPRLALSIRQPWAFAVAIGWKRIENRDWRKPNPGLHYRGPVAIHASAGMTRAEYEAACDFINRTGLQAPDAHELARGAIIGTAEIVDVIRKSQTPEPHSPWFFGPVGLAIENARML